MKTRYLSLQHLSSSNAQGVVDGIKKALSDAGLKVLTATTPPVQGGLGGNGCSTNRGEKGGVQAILKKEYPWFLLWWLFMVSICSLLGVGIKRCFKQHSS